MKEKEILCNKWKEGKSIGYARFKNCCTCHFAGYGVCCYPYPDEIDQKGKGVSSS